MTLDQNPRLFSCFCHLLSGVGIINLKFLPRSKQVILLSKSADCKKWKLRIPTVLVAVGICQCALNSDKLSAEAAVAGVGVVTLIACQIIGYQEKAKEHEITQYCNGLFQFEEKYSTVLSKDNKAPFIIWISILMVYATLITMVALPLSFVYGFHWLNPCKPSLVG